MQHKNCLNCNHHLYSNFCSHCGQKASTHRFSISHLLTHEFLHGLMHIDKGILFTLKELFTRPGHSIREYIQGKRINHYHFLSLLLIIVGAFIYSFYDLNKILSTQQTIFLKYNSINITSLMK